MKTKQELQQLLKNINHKGYPVYKQCHGQYDFRDFILSIDHVQSDPFASPSKVSVIVPQKFAKFPSHLFDSKMKRITLQDHLLRLFGRALATFQFKIKGSGKSGLLSASNCGQEVLERSGCELNEKNVMVRFEVGFPGHGRTTDSEALGKILLNYIPDCVHQTLYWNCINQKAVTESIFLCEDQEFIRSQLPKLGLCAFVANGSILPRESGVSSRPMKGATLFTSPDSLTVTLDLPHHGSLTGMGIPKGITLIVGGGYHGKSTLLKALELGVYNHIARDGREYVITDTSGIKLRAEDGRSISHVNISPFINHLPNGKDTNIFSTEDASGSTSQAANLMEGVETGTSLFLIDEDTSATNFMMRDELMQRVIHPSEEPITPLVEQVHGLYKEWGISSILVAGSCGSYFQAADRIIQMKNYLPLDITEKAKNEAAHFPMIPMKTTTQKPSFERCPKANPALLKESRLKIKTMGLSQISLMKDTIDLRYLEQLTDSEQTCTLAYALKYAECHLMNGKKTMISIVDEVERILDEKGFLGLCEGSYLPNHLARPRRQEIFACMNRYRKLYF